MSDKSDYFTDSEFQQDFKSDDEPPQDRELQKRLIYKGKDLRIYKEIIHLGERSLDKTAPIDWVYFTLIREDYEQQYRLFLGLDDFSRQDWIKLSLISMKRKEKSKFEIEWISKDQFKN